MMDALSIFWAILLVAGSPSLGYLILRSGWPKVRILDDETKTGWSILTGTTLTLLTILVSIIMDEIPSVEHFLLRIGIVGLLLTGAFVLAVRFVLAPALSTKRVLVSVPASTIPAQLTAEKLMEKVVSDQVILPKKQNEEKIEEIKAALERALKKRELEGNLS